MAKLRPERRPSEIRLRMAACMLAASSLLLPGCRQARPAPPSGPLRIATWNVQGCAAGIDEIIAELRTTRADVICLQEAETPPPGSGQPNQAAEIANRLGMHQYSAGSNLSNGNEQRMAILFRGELQAGEPLDANTGRIYGVTAVVPWQGQPIRVVCIHLTSSYRLNIAHAFRTSAARNQEAEDLVDRISRWKEPVLVAGDFNAVPGMNEHERLTQVAIRASTTQPTCPSNRPMLSLDHIYYSSRLRAVHCQVENTRVSDHLRVTAELVLNAPQNDRE